MISICDCKIVGHLAESMLILPSLPLGEAPRLGYTPAILSYLPMPRGACCDGQ